MADKDSLMEVDMEKVEARKEVRTRPQPHRHVSRLVRTDTEESLVSLDVKDKASDCGFKTELPGMLENKLVEKNVIVHVAAEEVTLQQDRCLRPEIGESAHSSYTGNDYMNVSSLSRSTGHDSGMSECTSSTGNSSCGSALVPVTKKSYGYSDSSVSIRSEDCDLKGLVVRSESLQGDVIFDKSNSCTLLQRALRNMGMLADKADASEADLKTTLKQVLDMQHKLLARVGRLECTSGIG